MNTRTRTALMLGILLALLWQAGGCVPVTASDYDKLYVAKQALDTTERTFETLIDTKVIKTQRQAIPIREAIAEAEDAVAEADAKLRAGDKLGWNFVMDRIDVLHGRILQRLSDYQSIRDRE